MRRSSFLLLLLQVFLATHDQCVAGTKFPQLAHSLWNPRTHKGWTKMRSPAADSQSSGVPNQHPSTNSRGGAAVAQTAVKTMTARQMEAFNLFSGGIAGTVASCITNPLEVIKAQLQSTSAATGEFAAIGRDPIALAKSIFARDGVAGFFRGLAPTLVGIIPARSAYFYLYQRSKKALGPYMPEGSPGNALVAGLGAGIAGNTLTNPIWMVRTRMQLLADGAAGQRVYAGYGDAIVTIFREEGMAGFYKGIMASYWGCTEGAIQFIIYEQIKTRLLRTKNEERVALGLPHTDQLSKRTYFCSAAAAKMVAAVAVYPHEVARTRLREQARDGVFKYSGMWQALSIIGKEEGRSGLYSGMGVHLLKVVPNSALMFLTYEVVRGWLGEFTIVDERRNPQRK